MSLKLIDYYARRIINLEINTKLSELNLIKDDFIDFDQDIRDAIEEAVFDHFNKDISELKVASLIFLYNYTGITNVKNNDWVCN